MDRAQDMVLSEVCLPLVFFSVLIMLVVLRAFEFKLSNLLAFKFLNQINLDKNQTLL